MTLVMKFGGTSVGSIEAIKRTAALILETRAAHPQLVIVASAMGTKPVKVTDLLLNGADSAVKHERLFDSTTRQIRELHHQTINGLLDEEAEAVSAEIDNIMLRYQRVCEAIYFLGEMTPRALDMIGGMGEQMSVRVLAAYLRTLGHQAEAFDATDLIVTDSNFGNAAPLLDKTEAKVQAALQPKLDAGGLPIVTGFIGANEDGITTTLGRGGSDFTASILGRSLGADEVWIWSDVDGILSADPRVVPSARSIPELSAKEVSELAFYGARVLHPKTVRPLVSREIPLRCKNTFNPNHPGTVIVPERRNPSRPLEAVTSIRGLSLVTVAGTGMLGIPGIAARTFDSVAQAGASVLLITQSSSEQSICFALEQQSAETVVGALEAEFSAEMGRRDIDRITAQSDVSIVTVVGAGMQHTAGVAGDIFSALGAQGVNIIAIAQGSSEVAISTVVADEDTKIAIELIHALIVPTT